MHEGRVKTENPERRRDTSYRCVGRDGRRWLGVRDAGAAQMADSVRVVPIQVTGDPAARFSLSAGDCAT